MITSNDTRSVTIGLISNAIFLSVMYLLGLIARDLFNSGLAQRACCVRRDRNNAFIVILRSRWQRLTSRQRVIYSIALPVILFAGFVFTYFKIIPPKRSTTYLIIDASANMEGYYEQIVPLITPLSQQVTATDYTEIGLMAVGGSVSGAEAARTLLSWLRWHPNLKVCLTLGRR